MTEVEKTGRTSPSDPGASFRLSDKDWSKLQTILKRLPQSAREALEQVIRDARDQQRWSDGTIRKTEISTQTKALIQALARFRMKLEQALLDDAMGTVILTIQDIAVETEELKNGPPLDLDALLHWLDLIDGGLQGARSTRSSPVRAPPHCGFSYALAHG